MENLSKEKKIFYSSSGSKERKGNQKKMKDTKIGWYIFLFLLFLSSYGFFTFGYFK